VSYSQWTLNGQSLLNLVKVCQIWSKSQRLVKGEGFNCKYWYFWMSLQIWTTGLKMGYLEN